MKVKKIALIGMGAVGIVYGRLLYDKFGSNFTVISDESRKDKLKEKGFTINGYTFYPNISSNGDNKDKYDLIIFAVKNYQLKDATRGTLNTKKTINKPNNTEKVVAIDIFLLTLPFRLLYIYSSTCFCNINSLIWLIEYMIQKTLPIISAKIVTV
jgi:predicted dinucleotide-binding enzyme